MCGNLFIKASILVRRVIAAFVDILSPPSPPAELLILAITSEYLSLSMNADIVV